MTISEQLKLCKDEQAHYYNLLHGPLFLADQRRYQKDYRDISRLVTRLEKEPDAEREITPPYWTEVCGGIYNYGYADSKTRI